MSRRPYTGTKEGVGRGRRPGIERFILLLEQATGGRLWNNGTYGIRPVRGGTAMSVHATGRAVDVSHRGVSTKRPGCDQAAAWAIFDRIIRQADELGVEAMADYRGPKRFWRCDWETWRSPVDIHGVADSIHIEFSPAAADDPSRMDRLVPGLVTGAPAPAPAPVPPEPVLAPTQPRNPVKRGSRGKAVEAIQTRLGVRPVDGSFGPITEAAVINWQVSHGLLADGIVGPKTWASLFGS